MEKLIHRAAARLRRGEVDVEREASGSSEIVLQSCAGANLGISRVRIA